MMDYRLPAEWEPQEAVQLTWPHSNTDWRSTLPEVTECYVNIAREIALREPLWIVTPEPQKIQRLLNNNLPERALARISLFKIPSNDTWARDHGFITLVASPQPSPKGDGTDKRRLLDFKFNAWGGKFEARLDNEINRDFYEQNAAFAEDEYIDNLDFELEGGSIESDGEGTIMTTVQCNLNPNRRSRLTPPSPSLEGEGESELTRDVEQQLLQRLHAKRIIWLHHGGLEKDDTDAHIDTLARFAPNDTIIYGEGCPEMEEELRSLHTLKGKPYNLTAVPPYYANFLIINGAVLVPFYEDDNENEKARQAIQQAFPDREIIGIDCCILLTQNGSLHCCTMQYPKK